MKHDLDVLVVCEINVDVVVTGVGAAIDFGAERAIDDVPELLLRARRTGATTSDAGFLSGLLAGEDIASCVRRGNACGALTAAHVGGSGGYDAAHVWDLLQGVG